MNQKLVITTTALALLAAGGSAWSILRHGRAEAVAVTPGPIREVVIAQGQVVAIAGTADVRALVDGRVIEVAVREGDTVAAGQLLARIDTAEIDAAIAAAEAELSAARASLTLDKSRAARDAEMAASGAAPAAAADDARRTADIARARGAAAAAELAAARARRERAVVVAPIAGMILARHVDAGDSAAPGTTLFELADPGATELRIEVEELDALRIGPGMTVEITSPGGRELLGRGAIARTSPQLARRTIGATDARVRAEAQVRSAWVRWHDDATALLPIGLRVEARIELPARQVTARVPRSAVRVDDGHAQVEVPGWHLFADQRTVELGATDEHWVEVSGLEPGTRVVRAP